MQCTAFLSGPPASPSCRGGTPSQALLPPAAFSVYLQWRAFHYRMDPADPSSPTLKSLLESPNITKLIYDVRSDASNLLRQFDVRLRGAYDLQLAEVAVRQVGLMGWWWPG